MTDRHSRPHWDGVMDFLLHNTRRNLAYRPKFAPPSPSTSTTSTSYSLSSEIPSPPSVSLPVPGSDVQQLRHSVSSLHESLQTFRGQQEFELKTHAQFLHKQTRALSQRMSDLLEGSLRDLRDDVERRLSERETVLGRFFERNQELQGQVSSLYEKAQPLIEGEAERLQKRFEDEKDSRMLEREELMQFVRKSVSDLREQVDARMGEVSGQCRKDFAPLSFVESLMASQKKTLTRDLDVAASTAQRLTERLRDRVNSDLDALRTEVRRSVERAVSDFRSDFEKTIRGSLGDVITRLDGLESVMRKIELAEESRSRESEAEKKRDSQERERIWETVNRLKDSVLELERKREDDLSVIHSIKRTVDEIRSTPELQELRKSVDRLEGQAIAKLNDVRSLKESASTLENEMPPAEPLSRTPRKRWNSNGDASFVLPRIPCADSEIPVNVSQKKDVPSDEIEPVRRYLVAVPSPEKRNQQRETILRRTKKGKRGGIEERPVDRKLAMDDEEVEVRSSTREPKSKPGDQESGSNRTDDVGEEHEDGVTIPPKIEPTPSVVPGDDQSKSKEPLEDDDEFPEIAEDPPAPPAIPTDSEDSKKDAIDVTIDVKPPSVPSTLEEILDVVQSDQHPTDSGRYRLVDGSSIDDDDSFQTDFLNSFPDFTGDFADLGFSVHEETDVPDIGAGPKSEGGPAQDASAHEEPVEGVDEISYEPSVMNTSDDWLGNYDGPLRDFDESDEFNHISL